MHENFCIFMNYLVLVFSQTAVSKHANDERDENKLLLRKCQRAKQEFVKRLLTSKPFACQTHAFCPLHNVSWVKTGYFDNKFLPP